MNLRSVFKLALGPVIAASLCCLSPIILVLLGLSTVSFATSLADSLYGTYKWIFRSIGLILLLASLIAYFWHRGVCTLDQVKKRRREIINTVLISVILGILGYVLFLYVVVHYIGVWMGVWPNY